jgi:nucleotide-binding universal stress UspA family protein
MRTIVVPLDGSALAERALPYAEALARDGAASLFLVRATLAHALPGMDLAEEQIRTVGAAEAYLAEVAKQLASLGIEADSGVVYGPPSAAILDEIRLRSASMVVMATHGRSGLGRWLYGSVADFVLHRSPVPVLLVPASGARSWSQDQRRILVPLDGSPLAEAVLQPATQMAEQLRQLRAELVLCRVVEPPNYGAYGEAAQFITFDPDEQLASAQNYLEQVAGRLRQTSQPVSIRALVGEAVQTIAALASESDVLAVAMATHGRGGLARFVLGSVATGTIQRAQVPILLVRPAAGAERGETAHPAATPLEFRFSRAELDLLQRSLVETLHGGAGDPATAAAARELLERLRAVERELPEGARPTESAP